MYFMFTQSLPWCFKATKNDFRRENVSSHDDIFLLIYRKLEIVLWI